jgi:hypothetical protein
MPQSWQKQVFVLPNNFEPLREKPIGIGSGVVLNQSYEDFHWIFLSDT